MGFYSWQVRKFKDQGRTAPMGRKGATAQIETEHMGREAKVIFCAYNYFLIMQITRQFRNNTNYLTGGNNTFGNSIQKSSREKIILLSKSFRA